MLPSYAKTEIWKQLAEDISLNIKAPVTIGQATYGKLPFFQELRNKMHDNPYSELKGVKYARITHDGHTINVGPFKTNETHALDEELTDARQKLPEWKEHYEQLITLCVQQAINAASNAQILTDALSRAKLLLEFSHATAHTKTLEQALTSAIQFIVHKFRLSNAYIQANTKHARHFDLTKPAQEAEQRIVAQLRELKSTVIIQNTHGDFLLKDIKDIGLIPTCIVAYPLTHERTTIGHAIFYSEQMPNVEGIAELLYELTTELNRLSEYEKAQTNASTDNLTGLNNRTELTKKMETMLSKLSSENLPISLMMIDADNFKRYNDTKGHPEGDKILKIIAEIIKATTPKDAFACRYGGEEFLITLPMADQHIAKELAEKIRQHVETACPLTVSIGYVTCMNSSASKETLIKIADDQLYRAKNLGKNRVCASIMVDKNLGVIDV